MCVCVCVCMYTFNVLLFKLCLYSHENVNYACIVMRIFLYNGSNKSCNKTYKSIIIIIF